MTTLVFTFPAGIYRATPWGHHVNEGLVEWPPSPWRILRGLVSVGFAALRWDEGVPPAASALANSLASAPPRYMLPEASLGHARHYMPLGVLDKGREKTTLVFDAFARPGAGRLAVTWPVRLEEGARALLAELARHMNYLGRSESWVEAELLAEGHEVQEGLRCWPCADGILPKGSGWEQVMLMGFEPPEEYARWRQTEVARALSHPDLAVPVGKKPSKKVLERRRQVEAMFPVDAWSALHTTTARLQSEGWSQPPGSRRWLYWRRADALQVGPPSTKVTRRPARHAAVLVGVSLAGGSTSALPAVTRTLPQAELLHRSAAAQLGRGGRSNGGLELVGRDRQGRPLQGHGHGHVLPLDLDEDGHLDHVLFWAPGGYSHEAIDAIRRIRRTWAKGTPDDLNVAVAAVGSIDTLLGIGGPFGLGLTKALAPSATWRSATPFLPPRHLKKRGRNTLEGQVLTELASRGLPEPTSVRVMGHDAAVALRFRHYVSERRHGRSPPPTAQSFAIELTFPSAVRGPICLGYGSHFGLGRFEGSDLRGNS